MPNSGCSIVLMVGDAVVEQLVMFDLVELTYPWISKQLDICHGSNRILMIVVAVPAVKNILAEALEVIDWFLNFKVQHAVFTKHSEGRTLLTSCDNHCGYKFIVMLRLLREVTTLQKAIGDPAYIEKIASADDAIKPRVNNSG